MLVIFCCFLENMPHLLLFFTIKDKQHKNSIVALSFNPGDSELRIIMFSSKELSFYFSHTKNTAPQVLSYPIK